MCASEKYLICNQGQRENSCHCHEGMGLLSKKKKIESLKKILSGLEEKSEDIREYIRELESVS
jgi:hypothetical protein